MIYDRHLDDLVRQDANCIARATQLHYDPDQRRESLEEREPSKISTRSEKSIIGPLCPLCHVMWGMRRHENEEGRRKTRALGSVMFGGVTIAGHFLRIGRFLSSLLVDSMLFLPELTAKQSKTSEVDNRNELTNEVFRHWTPNRDGKGKRLTITQMYQTILAPFPILPRPVCLGHSVLNPVRTCSS